MGVSHSIDWFMNQMKSDTVGMVPHRPPGRRADVKQILARLSEMLRAPDQGMLEEVYAPDTQVSIHSRILGHTGITSYLRMQNCEFTSESCSYIACPGNRVVASGTCTWGNQHCSFTFVFQIENRKRDCQWKILHQMIIK
jgi:hypothetical protein